VTLEFAGISIPAMASSPGRRIGTPYEFRKALARRVKYARELAGYTHAGIARLLTASVGREVSADTYRKWETTESSIAHDAILPFCDLTKTHPFQLLAKPSDDELAPIPTVSRKKTTA
jgi:hypothetical protein